MNSKAIFWLIGASAVIVAVMAFFVWISVLAPQRTPQITTNNQTTVVSSSAGQDDWQTYRNGKNQIEFKYPNEWSAENEDLSSLVVLKNAQGAKIISIYTGINLAVIGISYCGAYPEDKRCEILQMNGNSIEIDWGANGEAGAMISSSKIASGVSFSLHTVTPETKIIFRKILLTFKFIEDTSTWKTYRNEQYGFEIKYPTNWYIHTGKETLIISKKPWNEIEGTDSLTFDITVHKDKNASAVWGGNFSNECQKINFNGLEAYQCASQDPEIGFSSDTTLIERGSDTYEIADYYQNEITGQILSTFKFIPSNAAIVESCKKLVDQAEQNFGAGAYYPRELLLNECAKYLVMYCTTDRECGSFPCIGGLCVIQPCKADAECPNRRCGLHATPVPRFCTTIDVQ